MLRLKYDQLLSTLLAMSAREISERLGFSVDAGTTGTTLLSIMIVNLVVRCHPSGPAIAVRQIAPPGRFLRSRPARDRTSRADARNTKTGFAGALSRNLCNLLKSPLDSAGNESLKVGP